MLFGIAGSRVHGWCPRGDPRAAGTRWVGAPSQPDSPFSPGIAQSFHLLSFPAGRVCVPLCLDSTQIFLHLPPTLSICTLLSSSLHPKLSVLGHNSLHNLLLPIFPRPQAQWDTHRGSGLRGSVGTGQLRPCSPGASHGAGDAQEHPNPITTLSFDPTTHPPSRNYPSPVSQAGKEGLELLWDV